MTNIRHFVDTPRIEAPQSVKNSATSFTGFLDKSAQLPQINAGKGFSRSNYRKRAKAKYMTNSYVPALIELESDLKKSYIHTLFCSRNLVQKGDTITTKYCKNRWCMVCNRIRTAKLISGYCPELEKFADPYFVTLTIPNVTGIELRRAIDRMAGSWRGMYNQYKRERIALKGIRKTECTYNAEYDNYHPHFHFIVEGRELAARIVEDWLLRYPECERSAQNYKPANSGAVKELFKYFTKIYSYTKGGKGVREIYIPALDTIFRAMRRMRVFQPFGISAVSEEIEDIEAEKIDESIEVAVCCWNWNGCDWINAETGELLTGYEGSTYVDLIMKNAVF